MNEIEKINLKEIVEDKNETKNFSVEESGIKNNNKEKEIEKILDVSDIFNSIFNEAFEKEVLRARCFQDGKNETVQNKIDEKIEAIARTVERVGDFDNEKDGDDLKRKILQIIMENIDEIRGMRKSARFKKVVKKNCQEELNKLNGVKSQKEEIKSQKLEKKKIKQENSGQENQTKISFQEFKNKYQKSFQKNLYLSSGKWMYAREYSPNTGKVWVFFGESETSKNGKPNQSRKSRQITLEEFDELVKIYRQSSVQGTKENSSTNISKKKTIAGGIIEDEPLKYGNFPERFKRENLITRNELYNLRQQFGVEGRSYEKKGERGTLKEEGIQIEDYIKNKKGEFYVEFNVLDGGAPVDTRQLPLAQFEKEFSNYQQDEILSQKKIEEDQAKSRKDFFLDQITENRRRVRKTEKISELDENIVEETEEEDKQWKRFMEGAKIFESGEAEKLEKENKKTEKIRELENKLDESRVKYLQAKTEFDGQYKRLFNFFGWNKQPKLKQVQEEINSLHKDYEQRWEKYREHYLAESREFYADNEAELAGRDLDLVLEEEEDYLVVSEYFKKEKVKNEMQLENSESKLIEHLKSFFKTSFKKVSKFIPTILKKTQLQSQGNPIQENSRGETSESEEEEVSITNEGALTKKNNAERNEPKKIESSEYDFKLYLAKTLKEISYGDKKLWVKIKGKTIQGIEFNRDSAGISEKGIKEAVEKIKKIQKVASQELKEKTKITERTTVGQWLIKVFDIARKEGKLEIIYSVLK